MVTKWLDNRLFHPPCNFSVMVQSTQGLVRIHRPLKYETRVFDQLEGRKELAVKCGNTPRVAFPTLVVTTSLQITFLSTVGLMALGDCLLDIHTLIKICFIVMWKSTPFRYTGSQVNRSFFFSSGHFTGLVGYHRQHCGLETKRVFMHEWRVLRGITTQLRLNQLYFAVSSELSRLM